MTTLRKALRLAAIALGIRWIYRRWIGPSVDRHFHWRLVRHTGNFSDVEWLGKPVWQNVLDLWTIQEVIGRIRPALLVECGTNRGGSAWFYARLLDELDHGAIVSIDIEKLHDLEHPRIEFLIGSSVSEEILSRVRARVAAAEGPVLVILDSDHTAAHVRREMESYGPFVSPGSYMLVQDGFLDRTSHYPAARPGPLRAIEQFLPEHPEFRVDEELCRRFLITHHPKGWLRRRG